MIGIPYIQSLFQSIINVSLIMQGRFYLCPKLASEINNSTINEIVTNIPNPVKWPACLMMPPRKTGNFQFVGNDVQNGTNLYTLQLLFLRPSTYTAYNLPSVPLPNTAIPTHTIPETWHDMERCADDFMQVLQNVLDNNPPAQLFITEQSTPSINYVTDIGDDKLCGVLLSFGVKLNNGCDIEDYPADYLTLIELPDLVDTHLTHINS